MKRNPVVFTTLFVLILLILMVGNLYASARAGDSAQGAPPAAQGTEEYAPRSVTLAESIYMPLLIYEIPPVPPQVTATPTPTNTPTVTPTSTSLPNEVVINHIEPGAYGEEFVRVKNRTNDTVVITGWTIKAKESGRTYTFPKFYLDPDDAVRVWTKTGYNDGMDLYWGLSTEVWDDDDDCGRLGDDRDELLQWYCYSSGTPEAPTPTLAPIPDVIINEIENGSTDLDYYQEYVRVKNRTLSTVQMKGWTIKSDSTKLIYTFPDFKLKPNAAVRVWTQHGTDGDVDLYWGAAKPVWDNKDDCARLGNDDDELADWYCYP